MSPKLVVLLAILLANQRTVDGIKCCVGSVDPAVCTTIDTTQLCDYCLVVGTTGSCVTHAEVIPEAMSKVNYLAMSSYGDVSCGGTKTSGAVCYCTQDTAAGGECNKGLDPHLIIQSTVHNETTFIKVLPDSAATWMIVIEMIFSIFGLILLTRTANLLYNCQFELTGIVTPQEDMAKAKVTTMLRNCLDLCVHDVIMCQMEDGHCNDMEEQAADAEKRAIIAQEELRIADAILLDAYDKKLRDLAGPEPSPAEGDTQHVTDEKEEEKPSTSKSGRRRKSKKTTKEEPSVQPPTSNATDNTDK